MMEPRDQEIGKLMEYFGNVERRILKLWNSWKCQSGYGTIVLLLSSVNGVCLPLIMPEAKNVQEYLASWLFMAISVLFLSFRLFDGLQSLDEKREHE